MTRTILITGCSTGIGFCCARGMKARGWRVFATARKDADIARLKGEGLESLYLDYTEPQSVAAALAEVMAASDGRLDALFNNGAYAQPGAVEDLTMAAMREQFDANFFGWHDLTRQVIPVMRQQGHGRIVQNSSVLGLVAMAYRGAYTASKFALEGYSDTLRIELDGTGIHVATIEPGPIKSRLGQNAALAAKRHIDMEKSIHRDYYERRIAALEKGEGNAGGQLGPEAVLKVLVHACESARPRTHYYVTGPAHIAAAMRRVLPGRLLHAALTRAGRS
jgi:NAD(P)-dependent dehydrogenase (short-subunit alcohol dehydrogenase family)